MRLDQFLRASRLVLRRTVAQELCEAGAVLVGGVAARSSRAVRVGDEITIERRERLLTVRVLAVPTARQTSKHEAATLYEVVSDVRRAENDRLHVDAQD
jgi:ribosomal 50S subunit-recycling heat shock protein